MSDNTENLYHCTIEAIGAFEIQNIGGCISTGGPIVGVYETTVYKDGDNYIDMNNLDRIINFIETPQRNMPKINSDSLLYVIQNDSLVPLSEYKKEKTIR